MSITIKDLARLANVSRGTVDRVVNNRGGVEEKTKQAIEELIKKHNFKPNKVAAGLKKQSNPYKIGIILNSVGNEFFDDVLLGMEQAKRDYADFGLEFSITKLKGYRVEKQLSAMDEYINNKLDAIIVTPINDKRVAEKINFCMQNNILVLTLNSDIEHSLRLCYVGCDYLASGKTAAGMVNLVNRFTENKNIAIISGSYSVLGHNQRIEGFKSVLDNKLNIVDIIECNDDEEIAFEKTSELLKNKDIDILFVAAGGVVGTVKAEERFGKDIQIYTFDDTPHIKELLINEKIVATVTQQAYLQGYQSIKILYDKFINKEQVQDYYTKLNIEIKYNS